MIDSPESSPKAQAQENQVAESDLSPFSPEEKQPGFESGKPPIISELVESNRGSKSSPLVSASAYYENLSEGKKAIREQGKAGIVFLTNPEDEDNQRVEQIFGLSQFQDIFSEMIFIRIDVGSYPQALNNYGIYKTPSIVLYDSNGMLCNKIQCVSDMDYLLKILKILG